MKLILFCINELRVFRTHAPGQKLFSLIVGRSHISPIEIEALKERARTEWERVSSHKSTGGQKCKSKAWQFSGAQGVRLINRDPLLGWWRPIRKPAEPCPLDPAAAAESFLSAAPSTPWSCPQKLSASRSVSCIVSPTASDESQLPASAAGRLWDPPCTFRKIQYSANYGYNKQWGSLWQAGYSRWNTVVVMVGGGLQTLTSCRFRSIRTWYTSRSWPFKQPPICQRIRSVASSWMRCRTSIAQWWLSAPGFLGSYPSPLHCASAVSSSVLIAPCPTSHSEHRAHLLALESANKRIQISHSSPTGGEDEEESWWQQYMNIRRWWHWLKSNQLKPNNLNL